MYLHEFAVNVDYVIYRIVLVTNRNGQITDFSVRVVTFYHAD